MKPYKIFFLFAILVFNISCHSQSNELANYFPLNEGDIYVYQGKYNNKVDQKSILVRAFNLSNNKKIYYFQKSSTKNNAGIFGVNMFGNGMYTIFENKLWTLEAFSHLELYKINFEEKQVLLPEYLKVGTEVAIKSNYNNSIDKVQILGYDDIKVPFGNLDNCLKLKITTIWNKGARDESYIWLAKNIGLVKWIRSTGRVEELVNYIPSRK